MNNGELFVGTIVRKGNQKFVVTEVSVNGICGTPIESGAITGGKLSAGTIWPPFETTSMFWELIQLKEAMRVAGFAEETIALVG